MRSPIFSALIVATALLATMLGAETTHASENPACRTFVAGGTVAGATWTAAESPICVTGDLGVSLLTVEAGTTVLVDGPYVIDVLTTLNVTGTEAMPVVFTARDPAVRWRGLKFRNTPPGSSLSHCEISLSSESGLTIDNAYPDISNCRIHNNRAQNGAGVRITLDSPGQTLTITDSLIDQNIAAPGGIACNFTGPGLGGGGGVHAVTGDGQFRLVRSRVVNNSAGFSNVRGVRYGAGLYLEGAGEIDNSIVANNTVYTSGCPCAPGAVVRSAPGAGLYTNGDIAVRNSLITDNHSQAEICFTGSGIASGSAIYSASGNLTLSNVTVAGNTANGNGPANTPAENSAIVVAGGHADITNVSFTDNTSHAVYQKGTSTVSMLNAIAYFNAGGGAQLAGGVAAAYSNLQGGGGANQNIDFNPAFSTRPDRAIVIGSPSTDAGNPDASFDDICQPPSLGGPRNDQGAHGGPGACAFLDADADGVPDISDNCLERANPDQRDSNGDGYGNACDPDLDNDGVVNVSDLGLMRAVFFTNDPDADLNGDNVVNSADLGRLREMFFSVPGPSLLVY